jgi:cytoskeletal protein CcmA (bactofilin family)
MFTKGSKDAVAAPPAPKTPAPPSLLSTDLKITGDLVSQGEIQVDGQIDGDIHTDVLIVGETAQINGEISADTIRVHGYVTGQIKARSVSLAKTAHVLGDIQHESLSIEQGAFLEGHCRRIEGNYLENEGTINLLVKGGVKNKSDPPPKKAEAGSA